jgi:lipoprotein-anchoring transpeptidase ErfK/SrfK
MPPGFDDLPECFPLPTRSTTPLRPRASYASLTLPTSSSNERVRVLMGPLTSPVDAIRHLITGSRGVAGSTLLSFLLAAGCVGLFVGLSSPSAGIGTQAPRLPASPVAAFRVPKPQLLGSTANLTVWAAVISSTVARSAPGRRSASVTSLSKLTPEGTSNLVVMLGQGRWRGGEEWLRVRLAALPANETGWVPRRVLGAYEVVDTHLVVDRRRRRATLYKQGRAIFRAPVGVGRAASPTPAGQFYIRDRLAGFHKAFYGPLAFGTSARSATLTEWPDGGFVGLHGTDQPRLIPGAVSHGCIRFTNADIERLGALMPIGTPLTIR